MPGNNGVRQLDTPGVKKSSCRASFCWASASGAFAVSFADGLPNGRDPIVVSSSTENSLAHRDMLVLVCFHFQSGTRTMIDWSIEAVSFGNCNCDYGCPCQFERRPTQGNCRGFEVGRIERGHFGDVAVDGLCYAVVATARCR